MDPLWYKDAVIYEVHVRAFFDSNNDGIGDFAGLTQKLPYLQDLGITCLWLLPFYPSPLRDDGYDISDYTAINPIYGTIDDFKRFLEEAHARNIRVLTELVINHTSDQHPWFQRARRAPKGSPERDFYVWSDTDTKYAGTRIIFIDTEKSNWTFDPVAGQYYWHRFFSHQPDLNFDNPAVMEAVIETMRFWLDMGVDALRLDAIPYLIEREGTINENLPETHGLLKQIRRALDERYQDRVLLAEANQWPSDVRAYFGDGDECHMCFHFPLMPRIFMALRQEERHPIVEIMNQTPEIPESCQWAIFLRNHDELTLEMVTDEERDYMYAQYAGDPQMRLNLGIRRRLSPLMENSRPRIELMNSLLFSMPGTPIMYYGDEIGMGDNVYLGDRNSVRTPMQWSADRNAGFSSANRQQLYLPIIVDPEYHYEAINVDAQQANPHSLLWWTKRLIALRKRYQAFGRGSIEFLQPENRRILAFIRQYGDETILVVANLSRFVQHAELDLSAFEGRMPVELFGHVEFPVIGPNPYFLSLGPHAFMWFGLERPATPGPLVAPDPSELPSLPAIDDLADLARRPLRSTASEVLSRWARDRRWFRGKARRIRSADLRDAIPLQVPGITAAVAVLDVRFSDGDPETYLLPLAAIPSAEAVHVIADTPLAAIARLGDEATPAAILVDGMRVPAVCEALLDMIGRRRRMRGIAGQLSGQPTRAFRALRGPDTRLTAQPARVEQSNSSVTFGDRLMLKLYRRVEPGINPDFQIGEFLTEHGFPNLPAVAGQVEYRSGDGEVASAAICQAYVPNEGDAWELTLDDLGTYLERVVTAPRTPEVGSGTAAALLERASQGLPEEVKADIGPYLDRARLLGMRTGELHRALASRGDDPTFAPEPFSTLYQRSLYQSVRTTVRQNLRQLVRQIGDLPEQARPDAQAAIRLESVVDKRLNALLEKRLGGMRIRCHGDLHLGQILHTGRDFVFIDFEGEPGRPLSERLLKRSPLMDVAAMLRSFHYAASGSLIRTKSSGSVRPEDTTALDVWARYWYIWTSASFLRGYRRATEGASFLPSDDEEWAILLDVLVLQKAFHELNYELNNRPDWVTIPLQGIASLLTA